MTGALSGVQALYVSSLADLEGRGDVHFEKARPMHTPNLFTCRTVGRDQRTDGEDAVAAQQVGNRPTRLTFSSRSALEKPATSACWHWSPPLLTPSPLLRYVRTTSPSRTSARQPSAPIRVDRPAATLVFPADGSPVNQMVNAPSDLPNGGIVLAPTTS